MTDQICDITSKKRIVISPMEQHTAIEGLPNDWHLVRPGSIAVDGASIVLAGAKQANDIVFNVKVDLLVIALKILHNLYFAIDASNELEIHPSIPADYKRAI
ncbi:MAG: hypothetical protein AAFN93_04225 [Bacteroidota bacterium]